MENVKSVIGKNTSRHPFILILGSMDYLAVASVTNVPKYFVIITRFAIPCTTFMQAFDTSFKSFWLFHLEYPLACMGVWCFVESAIFERAYKKGDLSPNVKFLAVQMKEYYLQRSGTGRT